MPDANDLLIRIRAHTPADEGVRTCWGWLATAVEIGWIDQQSLAELIDHLRSGRDHGVEELLFERLGDYIRVSFHDEDVECSPDALLLALEAVEHSDEANEEDR